MKANGEYDETIVEMTDAEGVGDETHVYDAAGNLLSKTQVTKATSTARVSVDMTAKKPAAAVAAIPTLGKVISGLAIGPTSGASSTRRKENDDEVG